MDSTIIGALLGASLTAAGAAATAWWGNRKDSKRRQLEAIAAYLDSVESALAEWRTTASLCPKGIFTSENIYVIKRYFERDAQELLKAHWQLVATVCHACRVLKLRITNSKVRQTIKELENAVAIHEQSLKQLQDRLDNPVDFLNDYGDELDHPVEKAGNILQEAFGPDTWAPLLITEPLSEEISENNERLIEVARRMFA